MSLYTLILLFSPPLTPIHCVRGLHIKAFSTPPRNSILLVIPEVQCTHVTHTAAQEKVDLGKVSFFIAFKRQVLTI